MFDRTTAPGTEFPEFADDSPLAGRAFVFTASDFPGLFDLYLAPWAIAHKWHQRLPTLVVCALAAVAFIGKASRRFNFETLSEAPGAIMPVCLYSPLTSRTDSRHFRF